MTTGSSRVLCPSDGRTAATSGGSCAHDISRSREAGTDIASARGGPRQSAHQVASHKDQAINDRPTADTAVRMRPGSADDVAAVIAMHERCSPETVRRRYHVPVPRISPRLARALLVPAHGISVVGTAGDQIVAVGVIAADSECLELGLMVEDRWQHHGVGTRLLRCLTDRAREQGASRVVCVIQPDNTAVLTTIRRAGFRPLVTAVDGALHASIAISPDGHSRRRRGRWTMGTITAPLVTLLHQRAELREVYPAADLLDQAVRGGA